MINEFLSSFCLFNFEGLWLIISKIESWVIGYCWHKKRTKKKKKYKYIYIYIYIYIYTILNYSCLQFPKLCLKNKENLISFLREPYFNWRCPRKEKKDTCFYSFDDTMFKSSKTLHEKFGNVMNFFIFYFFRKNFIHNSWTFTVLPMLKECT
jgi:hypothetical protein